MPFRVRAEDVPRISAEGLSHRVILENVQELLDTELAERDLTRSTDFYAKYHSYDRIRGHLDDMADFCRATC